MRSDGWAVLLVCLVGVTGLGAHASPVPRSAEEAERMYPLGSAFSAWDRFSAATVAEEGRVVLDSALNDFASARFRNIFATLQADWKSYQRSYFICGEINSKNRFGAYIGWRHFVVADDNGTGAAPSVYFESIGSGSLMYQMDCTRGRDNRMLHDASVDWTNALLTGKSRYDVPAQH